MEQARADPQRASPERLLWPGIAALMAAATALALWPWDEAIHQASGYGYLERGDHGWNPEHPPLVKPEYYSETARVF